MVLGEFRSPCARALADIRDVGSALQAMLPGRLTLSHEDAAVFTGTVVNRLVRGMGRTASLYVNAYNTAALAAYRKIGFNQVGQYATILF